ncbi:L,D-transpeptidase [Azospirillum sp.]|uniref:L,D-transpeptidase n=1 Tax=Azospirillum sp. TaxID=34012 RepID=UPI002D6225B2|nr:L,D-transpeptidase [Azospirillum sp.]HYD69943.1 L,D-transpeptidase [Azospirillum sp.]
MRARTRAFVLACAVLGCVLAPGAARAQDDGPRIVISLADRKLYLMEGGAVRAFPVAIGRPGVDIPRGDSTVVRKRRNPTWHPTASQRRAKPSLPLSVPPGPDNPLGQHALDLGWTAIAIHGTNEPTSIGRRASSGCFRMLPDDIATVFAATSVGTPVRVVDAPFLASPPQTPQPSPQPVAQRAAPPPPPISAPVAAASPPAAPPPPDPRCATATAPLRRMICGDADLALLDGRARQRRQDGVAALPATARETAAYTLAQDDRRFDERVAALCWIRAGSEADPAAAASARACLRTALTGRLQDLEDRLAELRGRTPTPVAERPPPRTGRRE